MTTNSEKTFSLFIPTVDISPYLRNRDSAAARQVVKDIRAACISTGFFQIVGHGMRKELQKAVFDGAKRFFNLPFAVKKSLDAQTTTGHRGYDVLASQAYGDDTLPDLKEGFFVGEDMPTDDPRVVNGRFFMGPNVWPDPSMLSTEEFREPMERYHTTLHELTIRVLEIIEDTLPYGRGIFADVIANNPVTPMRILHYPPARPDSSDKPQFGASAHTDFGTITLLLQDESPGLEVLDARNKTWVPVPPNPDAYVVNIGDLLSVWTGNGYVSNVHRVINRSPQDRYSVVFFFDGNLDAELRALDGSEKEVVDPLTVEKHMRRRFTESYAARS